MRSLASVTFVHLITRYLSALVSTQAENYFGVATHSKISAQLLVVV